MNMHCTCRMTGNCQKVETQPGTALQHVPAGGEIYFVHKEMPSGNKLDSTVEYGSGQNVKTYGGIEPRATLRYAINEMNPSKPR
jgi:hypothetical protein